MDNEEEVSQGTSILEREAKLRGDMPEPTVRIIEKGDNAADTDADDDNDDGEGEVVTAPAQMAPEVPKTADPGEYKPADYGFEVQIYDKDGNNPKTRKITSLEQWDDLLESDPNLGSASALLKAQRNATKMETSGDRDKRDYDAKKATFDAELTEIATRRAAVDTMTNEIGYLQARGDLPAVAKEYVDADWSDPEIAKKPGVKEQLQVLNYMRDENKRRVAANLKPMTSILDAFNAFQIDQAKKGNTTRRQQAGEQRKAAGARVAGVSSGSPSASAAPAGVSVGRGGSLRDLGRQGF